MSAANSFSPALLGGAVVATRRALRRLEEEEIPARVRVVAKRSGKLPAPLASSLISELDRNEWLRKLALEELGDADGVGSEMASIEFLRREPGWEDRLTALAKEAETAIAEESHRLISDKLAAAKEEIQSLRRQLRKTGRQTGQAPTKKAESADRELEIRKLRTTLRSTQKELAASEAAREGLMSEVAQLQERLDTLLRRRSGRSAPPTTSAAGMRRGPLDLARDLDARLHAWSLAPAGGPPPPPAPEKDPSRPPSIPIGVRPDTAGAIEWLLSYPRPLTVAVDGWNLAFQLKNPPGRKERSQVEAAVGRLSHRSVGKRKLLVLFDSRFDVAGPYRGTHPHVEVRFPGSADEALIELAETESSLVVITSDRRVREEAGRLGAIGLWGEALVDWLK
ncbi:MAG TPA: hypothetical protein VJ796_03850 [Acidimicrobiia bacterium]|nr:hypothetical protein [Acidimicrobiia bacterium]